MSDTPRTDEATFDVACRGLDGTGSRVAVVHYQFARDLEKELSAALFEIQEWKDSSPCETPLANHALIESLAVKTCEWRCGDPDFNLWNTCGSEWQLTEGTPTENGMKFCPICGGKLIEKKFAEIAETCTRCRRPVADFTSASGLCDDCYHEDRMAIADAKRDRERSES